MPNALRPPKVAIIGCGMVGSTLAYTMVVERVAGELILVDANEGRARGEARDISHALPFGAPTAVRAGGPADCAGADVVVITAGAAQKPGQTRIDLAARNVEITRSLAPPLAAVAPDALFLLVSNPVDILTYAALKASGLPWQRVIGSGTVLDTARFRAEIGAHCGVDPRNVHAYILGEHGDTEIPVWSLTNIAGAPLRVFCQTCPRRHEPEHMDQIFQRVKNAAYEIIALKGATYYAIALATTRMIEAILRDQRTIVTASVLAQGQYGIQDVCLSLPVVLGRRGVERIVDLPLSGDERQALNRSADALKAVLRQVGF